MIAMVMVQLIVSILRQSIDSVDRAVRIKLSLIRPIGMIFNHAMDSNGRDKDSSYILHAIQNFVNDANSLDFIRKIFSHFSV